MLKLNERSIKWALLSIKKHLDTYIFPRPFEFDAIEENKEEVIRYLANIDLLDEGIRGYRTALTPKSVMGFRISTQLDPLDTICSHSILYEISEEIEQARLPKTDNISHSFRLMPGTDGSMYDNDYSWSSFKKTAEMYCDNPTNKFVLVTDIADFYPSIYLHDIETVLTEAVKTSGKISHAKVLINYIKAMHLNQTHKGIPVGPQFSRPLAELILDEIDRILKGKGIIHCRYVDDIYIFSDSEKNAYKYLAELAQLLYDRRGLKLNEKKTEILSISDFAKKHLSNPQDTVNNGFVDKFYSLLEEIGLNSNPYDELDPASISLIDWNRIKKLSLESMFEEQFKKDEIDYFLIAFLLMNFARFDNTRIEEIVLKEENIIRIFPKMRNVVNYLIRIRSFSKEQKTTIGTKILNIIMNCYISAIPFNRVWLLHIFTISDEWNNVELLEDIQKRYNDPLTERELYLALGRAHNYRFFRSIKDKNLDVDSWTKRAFIASISTLPKDERDPWYRSRELRSRDFLEKIIEKWARKNPFA